MGGMFNIDGPLFRLGNTIADIMLLSFLWLIFSIPIITIGASTTALYYVTTRRISDRESYIFKDFLSSFKTNFKTATLLWFLWLAAFTIILLNLYMLQIFEFSTLVATILLPIQGVLLIELIMTSLYMFPITARFEMSFSQIIKTAFFMANKHLLTTALCVLIGVGIIILTLFIMGPLLILIGMGLYAYLTSYLIMNIFKKYRPEIDAENSQDLEPLP